MTGSGKEKSLTWLTVSLTLLVTFVGWGFLAGSYAESYSTPINETDAGRVEVFHLRRTNGAMAAVVLILSSVIVFCVNAIAQLPNLPWVIGWHLTNRVWLLIVVLLAEGGVLGICYGLRHLEYNLSRAPGQPKKRRGREQRPVPQPPDLPKKKRRRPEQTLGDGYGDFLDLE